jgi:Polyketide cyclase / dehydrase and lipid transport
MEFTIEQHIRCTPERAFDLMADARNEPRWNSQVSRTELRSDEPIGLGSRFVIVNRGQAYDTVIATYERPSVLVFEATGPTDLTIAYAFRPAGEATSFRADYDFRPKGASRLLMTPLKRVIRRSLHRESASFAALCESG